MDSITLDAASGQQWDVAIAGTSFAAMFFARELPPNTRVLFLEKGDFRTHAERIDARGQFGEEKVRQVNHSGVGKTWIAHSAFGGNSNCWWGCTPRFHPNDFRMKTLYGVGEDWPHSYDQLEELYCHVEDIMDIAGGGSDAHLPRSRPFPSPPHRPSLSDRTLRRHAPADWFAQPTARSNGERRQKCCANGVCGICPVEAKFTILNSLDQFQRPDFFYAPGAEVRHVVAGAGVASHLEVRSRDGRMHKIKADLFALGANALFNAAILLRSGFSSPALGRYIHEQTSRRARVDVAIDNFQGGTSITGHNYSFYDGAHRREAAAIMVENWNAPPDLRMAPGKWTHRLSLKLIADVLPDPDNRVVLDNDEPVVEWKGYGDYTARGLDRAIGELPSIIPSPIEAVSVSDVLDTEGHILGTTRMGSDVRNGVVDKNLRTFEASNVLALGSGTFPSCAPANPTLTLSVLSVHAARSL